MNNCAANPLKTRADKVRLRLDLIRPLLPCLSAGKARLHLGDTGAVYGEAIAAWRAIHGCRVRVGGRRAADNDS